MRKKSERLSTAYFQLSATDLRAMLQSEIHPKADTAQLIERALKDKPRGTYYKPSCVKKYETGKISCGKL